MGSADTDAHFVVEVTDLEYFILALQDDRNDASKYLLSRFKGSALGQIYSYGPGKNGSALLTSLTDELDRIAGSSQLLAADESFKHVNFSPTTRALIGSRSSKSKLLNQMVLCDAFPEALQLLPAPSPSGKKCVPSKDEIISKISRELDEVDRSATEWGRATVSDIALLDNSIVPGSSNGYFALQFSQPTEVYMNDAAQIVNGTAQVSKSTQTSVGLNVSYSPTGGAGSSAGAGSNTLVTSGSTLLTNTTVTSTVITTNTSPTNTTISTVTTTTTTTNIPPAPAPTSGPTPGGTNAAAGGGGTSGTGTTNATASNGNPGAANTNAPATTVTTTNTTAGPQLSWHTVLPIGASDKIEERLLNYMSDPIHLPDNKRAYLGVMQVSVLPGSRTKKGYICEVQVNFELAMSKSRAVERAKELRLPADTVDSIQNFVSSRTGMAEKLKLPANEVPTIISAFPFAEAQVLDLSSSLQKQLSLLAQLSAMIPQVPGLQAQLQASYNKLSQQNLNTLTALPLVVPSSQGSDVTYRFDPELQALVEPEQSSGKSGHVLEPSSFPALVVIICEESDLEIYDSISAAVETRWIPEKYRDCLNGPDPGAALSNGERLQNARDFDTINDDMGTLIEAGFTPGDYAAEEVTRRFENLKTTAMGRTLFSSLPPVRPYVKAVYPPQFRQDSIPPQITIRGHYFKTDLVNLKFVGLQGIKLPFYLSKDEITASVPQEEVRRLLSPGPLNLQIVTDAGETTWTDAVTMLPVPPPVLNSATARPILSKEPIKHQRLTILGQNFVVMDNSLKVAVGGAFLPSELLYRTDQTISTDIEMRKLGLKPGNYDVLVTTSGGTQVLTNAVAIDSGDLADGGYDLPAIPPAGVTVFPDKFPIDSPPGTLRIGGNYFTNSESSAVRLASLGGINLPIIGPTNDILSVSLPADRLAATNYDLELVSAAGRTVISNAVQVLPAAAPVVTAVFPSPIKVGPFSSNNPAGNVPVTIIGRNLAVHDGQSLKIAIGGILVEDQPNKNDTSLSFQLSTNLLASLKAGKYDIDIFTSHAEGVATNAVEVSQKGVPVPADAPAISTISPNHGHLFSTTEFTITGSNFMASSWIFKRPKVKAVTIGGRGCAFNVVSDSTLIAAVPPWSKFDSTNDLFMATNKMDVVVITSTGVATSTNAVYFDYVLPNDANSLGPLSSSEKQAYALVKGQIYEARVLNTNLLVNLQDTLSVVPGGKSDSGVPSVSAGGQSGSNNVPGATKTNSAPQSP